MTPLSEFTKEQKDVLVKKVLMFFSGEGNFSENMDREELFEDYDKYHVKAMRTSLNNTGLISIINGKSTKGAAYGLTKIGKAYLNVLIKRYGE